MIKLNWRLVVIDAQKRISYEMTIESRTFVEASVLVVEASTILALLRYCSSAHSHISLRELPVTWAWRWTELSFVFVSASFCRCLNNTFVLLLLQPMSVKRFYLFFGLSSIYSAARKKLRQKQTAIDNWNLRLIFLWLNADFFFSVFHTSANWFSWLYFFDTTKQCFCSVISCEIISRVLFIL